MCILATANAVQIFLEQASPVRRPQAFINVNPIAVQDLVHVHAVDGDLIRGNVVLSNWNWTYMPSIKDLSLAGSMASNSSKAARLMMVGRYARSSHCFLNGR